MANATEFIDVASAVLSSVALAAVAATAILAGRSLRRVSIGSVSFGSGESGITPSEVAESVGSDLKEKPFETKALSDYYNQALRQAKVSFWFSLLFASIGFGVILLAFATYDKSDLTGALIKVSSGAIIDAISALFFVQSNNAQRAMGEFFEKLRLDRLNVEARQLISEIENEAMRDQLRGQMVLKYSGIDKLLSGASLAAPPGIAAP
jgi:hypothetical protein